MCGITGILHFEKARGVSSEQLKRMTDVMDYRGPDAEGFFVNGNIGLGHRRLSIIDLAYGAQPMFSDDRSLVAVLNGEIYNYIELREELVKKGYRFSTSSDTEVLIKAYEEWGTACQEKLNGMWAFAIWDAKKERLFLSRDRIGEKPLQYALYDNSLVFGSEIKSLFSYGIHKEPLLEFLEIYAVFKMVPAPYSFFKHIKKLMPGHYLLADTSGVREHRYWDLPAIDEDRMNSNAKEVNETFEHLFEDSIRIRMRCDVPFGAFLSGGLDSASIVASMSRYSKHPVNTFTIGYQENEFDESHLAALVAKKFGTNHQLGAVQADDFDRTLERIVHHYDEPFGDSSAIPTGYVSKFAAEKVKMVLTGDGGDEVLSGYSSYQGVKFAQKYQKLPPFVQRFLPQALGATSKIVKGKYRYTLNRYNHLLNTSSQDFNYRLIDKQAKPGLSTLRNLINPSLKMISVNDYISGLMSGCSYKDDFYKQMYLNFKFDLPNDYLVKVDRMSMAYSLETRLPFLDHRLIEFMAGVDKDLKMKGWERKSILKNTIAKKLPPELLKASKKGFRVPVREWFRSAELQGKLKAVADRETVFRKEAMTHLINDNTTGKADHGNLLWSMMVLDKML